MHRPAPLLLLASVAILVSGRGALAGPQHWGFGFPYLVTIEDVGGAKRLVAFEPPLFAQDCTWPVRWLDRTTGFAEVAPGSFAVGNFWPGNFAKEYLATVALSGGNLTVRVYEPPECFSTAAWTLRATSGPIPVSGTLLGVAAGDLRNLNKDQLLVALQSGSSVTIAILTPPSSPTGTAWSKSVEAPLPGVSGTYLGLAAGDFWNENDDHLALATWVNGATQLAFYSYSSGGNTFSGLVTDAATDLPAIQTHGLAAADFEKDGFDALVLASAGGTFQLRVAPAKPGQGWTDGEEYNGKSLAGQWLPGNGGPASLPVMSGTLPTGAATRLGFAAGRIFGYINTDLNARYPINNGRDAQIAFVRRSPRKDECPPYGWPALNQPVTYEINVNNNGNTAIAAGQVRLKVWYNRPSRSADTDPATCDSPDYDQVIDATLPAYFATNPTYVARTISFPWPYSLEPAGVGATWQRLNVGTVGERWVIAVLEYAGDVNLRNNRYELAVHGLTFHPLLRYLNSLADRQPTVQGDPPSKEYLCRKIADAVQSMWERSQTLGGEPVLQRLWFDSYEIGWPDDAADPQQAWQIVQSKYEGWRELDGWWGVYQGWERFNWGDGGAELHETGHLFHPLGDLYQYYISPVFTGSVTMDDGTPVQLRTWVWPADSYGEGQTRISWPACELQKRHLVGVRNNWIDAWWTLCPERTWVRVLDRHGQPVAGAEVRVWADRQIEPFGSGETGADGRWETTSLHGSSTIDAFGRLHHYNSPLNGTQIYTVHIGDYQEAAVLGSESRAAHSQHTKLGHALVDQGGWTWDLRTNYDPAAPAPSFELLAAVEGSVVTLGVYGATGSTLRVYRRWEPAYIRTFVGEFSAGGGRVMISQDMAAPDGHGAGRFRAIYEVTEVAGGGESLPRIVQVTGISGARGLSTRTDGKLLLAANAGIANPFCQVLDGTTPQQELFYHFRFGHTANRVVESRLVSGKYYATLAYSDMDPDYRFDLVRPPTQPPYGYDVRNDIGGFWALAYGTTPPYWIRVNSAAEAARLCPGDRVHAASAARVTSIAGDTLYVDGLIFSGGSEFWGTRLAGTPGTNAEWRELSNARGLCTLLAGGGEYVAIADTGNRRCVIWDADTRYVTHWPFADTTLRPAAVAAHPTIPAAVFVLSRRTSGTSQLDLFHLNGGVLSPEEGYPVSLPVGDATDVTEMGLAAGANPATGDLMLLVTDARYNKVLEYTLVAGAWENTATYTQASGLYSGEADLWRPADVTYVAVAGELRRYAVDGGSRVVRLDPDIDGDGAGDEFDNCPDIYNPDQTDTDHDGLGDACDPLNDCNGNGIDDATDIAEGTSPDCNTNGTPDECDLAFGVSADVDTNGVPDECQFGPTVASILVTDHHTVRVVFSVPVEEQSAETVANYAIDQGVAVLGAALAPDTVTVVLTTTPLTLNASYVLTAGHIFDRDDPPDMLPPGSDFPFTYTAPQRVTDQLVLLYDFEEAAGATVHDLSGYGTPLNLTIEHGDRVTWTPGGLRIDEPTRIYSAVAASKAAVPCKNANSITLEAWLVPAAGEQGGPARILTASNTVWARDFMLAQGGDSPAGVYEGRARHTASGDLNALPALVSPEGVPAPVLQHLVYTRATDGMARLYLDGAEIAADLRGGTFANWHTGYRLVLANEFSGDRPWLGELRLVAVYAKALSPGEVMQNYLAGPGGPPAILVGDLNCSGAVGFDDINAFVLRLSNPAGYFTTYPDCPDENGDINGDGHVGFEDINPFVGLLTGGL